MKILIAGSSGLIGTSLVEAFKIRHWEVTRLVRHAPQDLSEEIFWNPYQEKINLKELEGFDVVINLCGESIMGRWTKEKQKRLYDSRVLSSKFLVKSLFACSQPPKTYIQASAVGYYGDTAENIMDEQASAGNDFLAKICIDWENEAYKLMQKSRIVITRFGVVLSRDGGALRAMLPAFKRGLGGKLGSGRQYISWAAIEDVVNIFEAIILNEAFFGPINVVAPQFVTNDEFTKMLAKALHRPYFFTLPSWLLKMVLGRGASFLLSSIRATPRYLLDHHYSFIHPSLESAFANYFEARF